MTSSLGQLSSVKSTSGFTVKWKVNLLGRHCVHHPLKTERLVLENDNPRKLTVDKQLSVNTELSPVGVVRGYINKNSAYTQGTPCRYREAKLFTMWD